MQLDQLDRRIISELSRDGSASYSMLARKFRHGRDTIEYRVKRLIDRGIIRGFRAVIDTSKLGLTVHKSYLRLRGSRSDRNKLLSWLKKNDAVFWFAECSGEWDLVIAFVAKSSYEFFQIEGEILTTFDSLVVSNHASAVVQFWIYGTKFLKTGILPVFEVGGTPRERILDPVEIGLLGLVSRNARASIQELAEKLSSTPAIIRRRLDQLEAERIIIGYHAEVDVGALGYSRYKAQFFLSRPNALNIEQLRIACAHHENVYACMFQLGEFRIEIEIDAPNFREYNRTVDELREPIANAIVRVNTLVLHSEYLNWKAVAARN